MGRTGLLYYTVQGRYQLAEQDYCIVPPREDISGQNRTTVLMKISVGRRGLLYCTVQGRYQWAEQDNCIVPAREDISGQNRTTVLMKISVGRTELLYCTTQGRYQWAEQNYCTGGWLYTSRTSAQANHQTVSLFWDGTWHSS